MPDTRDRPAPPGGSSPFERLSRDELIEELKALKKRKKFGLVWEERTETIVQECRTRLPVLVEVKSKAHSARVSAPVNVMIEGDNLHALSVLNYTHSKKIDVIFIDPPYNTGARDWKYNNNFVDDNDAYRHSKWLSMMSARLRLARNLLKSDGVLICTIDDNEFFRLGCLLEEIFFGFEIHCVTIVHNPRGVQGSNFSYTHEYAYFVFRKNLKVIGERELEEDEIDWSPLRNWGGESERSDARNCFYPVIVKRGKIVGFGDVLEGNRHPRSQTERKGDKYYVWPIDGKGVERKWRYARQSVEQVANLLRVKEIGKRLDIEIGKDFGTVRTVWRNKKYDANSYGSQLVKALTGGKAFDYPKSLAPALTCSSYFATGNR